MYENKCARVPPNISQNELLNMKAVVEQNVHEGRFRKLPMRIAEEVLYEKILSNLVLKQASLIKNCTPG